MEPKSKPKSPLVFRLDETLNERLEKCAKELRLKKYHLAILALEAAIEAVEKNDYRLVLPIRFHVQDVPAPAPKAYLEEKTGPIKYPEHEPQFSTAEEQSILASEKVSSDPSDKPADPAQEVTDRIISETVVRVRAASKTQPSPSNPRPISQGRQAKGPGSNAPGHDLS